MEAVLAQNQAFPSVCKHSNANICSDYIIYLKNAIFFNHPIKKPLLAISWAIAYKIFLIKGWMDGFRGKGLMKPARVSPKYSKGY
jgi:hypothetical protein